MRKPSPRKCDHNQVIEDFKRLKVQSHVALLHNISRERVRQLVQKYCPEIKPLSKIKHDYCMECKRTSLEVDIRSGGYCNTCTNWRRKHPEGYSFTQHTIRKLLYPKQCAICRTVLKYKKKYHGMCMNCAYKYNDKFRKYRQEGTKRWTNKNRERVYAHNRKYYYDNKEKLSLYMKEYNRKKRVKVLQTRLEKTQEELARIQQLQ